MNSLYCLKFIFDQVGALGCSTNIKSIPKVTPLRTIEININQLGPKARFGPKLYLAKILYEFDPRLILNQFIYQI